MNKLRVVQPQRRAKPANLLKTQANHRSRPRAPWGRERGSFSSYFSPERNTQTQTRLTALGLWQSLPGHGPKIKSFCFCFLHRQRSLVPERKTHKGTFKISPGMMLSKKQKDYRSDFESMYQEQQSQALKSHVLDGAPATFCSLCVCKDQGEPR